MSDNEEFIRAVYRMTEGEVQDVEGTAVGLAFAVGRVGSIVATAAGGWLAAAQLEPRWNFWAWILPMLIPAIALAFVRMAAPAQDTSENSVA